MYNNLIHSTYQLPIQLDTSQSVIKAQQLEAAFTLQERLTQWEKDSIDCIEVARSEHISALEQEKNTAIARLNEQVQHCLHQQELLFEKIEQASTVILTAVLERFHLEISQVEKLHFSVKELIQGYQHKQNISLVVQSMSAFTALEITLPAGWTLEEDPNLTNDCQLKLHNGTIVCDFDSIYQEICQKISLL